MIGSSPATVAPCSSGLVVDTPDAAQRNARLLELLEEFRSAGQVWRRPGPRKNRVVANTWRRAVQHAEGGRRTTISAGGAISLPPASLPLLVLPDDLQELRAVAGELGVADAMD